jgi:hypothetical protein
VLNDPQFRAFIEKEYQGLKILNLHTHQPGNVFSTRKAVRKVADFKGVRLRFPSGPIKELVIAAGGTPVEAGRNALEQGRETPSVRLAGGVECNAFHRSVPMVTPKANARRRRAMRDRLYR